MRDLGEITNVEVIQRFLSLQDKDVVDIGCGALTFTRHLADLGARVLAIDPDPVQAEKNRTADPIPNIKFMESGGDQIPAEDGSIDGVFYSYSLHHIPAAVYPAMFQEVFRVLKPGGFIYTIEPIDCPLNQVMMLFHNEEVERAAAWNALDELAAPAFESREVVTYHGHRQYDSWDHFVDVYANKSFNSLYSDQDVRRPAVEKAFHLHGGPDHLFQSPKNVMLLNGFKP